MNSKVSLFYENGVFQDLYKVLEVGSNATKEEMKSNYRRLSRKFHPDAPTGNAEMMQKLNVAYDILNDDQTKKLYDEYYTSSEKQQSSVYCYNKSNNRTNSNYNTSNNQTSSSYRASNNQGNSKRDTSNAQRSSRTYTSQSNSRKSSYGETIYFSNRTIREMLKKCGYEDVDINGFLLWCGIHGVQISTGKELHAQFAIYQQSYKSSGTTSSKRTSTKATDFKKEQTYSKRYSFDRDFRVPKRNVTASMTSFEEPRLSIFGQYMFNSFIKQYCYQSYRSSFYRPSFVSNLNVCYSPVYFSRIVLFPYFSTSKTLFYSKPKSYTYRMCA